MPRRVVYADFAEIKTWFDLRGKSMGPIDLYPATGYMLSGTAAGFIYLTNSATAFIESFITNPNAGIKARAKAVNEIADALLELAWEGEYRHIFCSTNIRSIKRLAETKGFKYATTTGLYLKTTS